ncbi:MAG: sensor histidine kinase [Dokdonia sp.]
MKSQLWFWGCLMATFAIIQFVKEGNQQHFLTLFIQNLRHLPAYLLVAYIFNDYVLIRQYKKQKYVLFTVSSLLLFYLGSAFDRLFTVYVYEPIFRAPPFEQESVVEILRDWEFLITGYFTPILLATFAMTLDRMIRARNESEKRILQLERDKNKAQLAALKSQIHPHFLFNTLNSLYALSLQKSDKAPAMVAALAELLDYMLYQCDDQVVPLEKELHVLDNYIELERLRYGDALDLSFSPKGQSERAVLTKQLQIAPLVLLSIVENAFKHGASQAIAMPKISIDISRNGSELCIIVGNSHHATDHKQNQDNERGIGVNNIKQQLELLYPDHSYTTKTTAGWYEVNLRINTQI